MVEPPRRIAHLDMDAFFASVELLRYPELRGQPVVIGGRNAIPVLQADGSHQFARLRTYVGRGVITTATYEARAFGVGSAMGMMKAAKLAPDAILLPANFEDYRHYSRLFKQAVAAIAPQIEDRGIDEIFIDLTDVEGETDELAARIKQAVFDATGLTCSIGITPNKLLSLSRVESKGNFYPYKYGQFHVQLAHQGHHSVVPHTNFLRPTMRSNLTWMDCKNER